MGKVQINDAPYHIDFSKDVGIIARIENAEVESYLDQEDGDFECTILIKGCISLRPDGVSVSDAVGVILYALVGDEAEEDSSASTLTLEKPTH